MNLSFNSFKSKVKSQKSKKSFGFTLIELLVVISIFTIITSVLIFNESKFSSNVLITNLAYQVALAVRQAQVYGIGVRASTESTFNGGYGVHFDTSTAGGRTTFISFNDSPTGPKPPDGILKGDGIYEAPGSQGADIILNTYNLQKGDIIERLCIMDTTTNLCTNETPSILDITFVRPNPDATFFIDDQPRKDVSEVAITVETPTHDKCRIITVDVTGQISVPVLNSTNPQCTP